MDDGNMDVKMPEWVKAPEPIEPLPENIEIERVIDEDSAKVYSFKTTLLFLDDRAPGLSYEGCEVGFENPVPVRSDGQIIGFAALSVDNKAVEAEVFLKYDCPERLTIETKSAPMYASFTACEAVDTSGEKQCVAFSRITDVDLTSIPNPDERIGKL